MDVKEMVIEVNGLPEHCSDNNKMIDKLTMHFLRPSNNGGEVLIVIYPTSNKGQAYVVFESEVPRVLEHKHVLDLDSKFYPLDVNKIHQPKFDMPAEAYLDVSMFSSQKMIQNLLHNHGFDVSETSPGHLHLQGTFLNLKRIHPKLMHLLAQETQPQRRTPSHYTNGYSSDSVFRVSSDYESRSHSTSRHSHNNGHSAYAASRNPHSGINSRSPESPTRQALMQAGSPLDVSSSTEGSFRVSSDYESRSHSTSRHSHNNGHSAQAASKNPHSGINSRSPESPNRQALMQAASPLDVSSSTESSFSSPTRSYKDSSKNIRQQNTSSPRKTEDSFHVDLDVFNYVIHFKESFIAKIESDYHTKVHHENDSGCVKVKLSGGACEEAAKNLSKFMQEMSSSLRTHKIDLKKLDSSQRKYIVEKAYSYQDIFTVLIRQEGNTFKVVGSSKNSYEAKEQLLGREVNNTLTRDFTKNILRRSMSLPRQKTRTREDVDLGRRPDANYATTVTSSSATHSRTDSQLQPEVQQERGRKLSKSSAQHGRAKSASRLEHKNQSRVNQEPPANDEQDLTPNKELKISKGNPNMKSTLLNLDQLFKNSFHFSRRK